MQTIKVNKREKQPSTRITVRFHENELKHMDKQRKKASRSDFIRFKVMS
jgi:hypothetical protein